MAFDKTTYNRGYGIKNRERFREKKNKSTRLLTARLKQQVIDKFSKGTMQCVICGESRIYCLSIDHIHGGGSQHRRELRRHSPRSYYKWLIEEGSHKDFQVLCMNCQFVKRYEQHEYN